MGQIRSHDPVLLIMAAFSRDGDALEWAARTAIESWGPLALASQRFDFQETSFYERSMGSPLVKAFFAFERLIDPAALVDLKHQTNDWEGVYGDLAEGPEPRPLNLDPGYLTEAKLVLASTKDRDHRLYLGRGIFAENTLYFHQGRWQPRAWTYPNYRRADYHQFFVLCRDYLRRRYRRAT